MAREMKDSGVQWIGSIPGSWEIKKLKHLFSFGKGLPITKEKLTKTGIPVISYGQIHGKYNSGVRIHDELIRYVPEMYLETNPESLVHEGDLILADTSEDIEGCGNCAYIDKEGQIFAGYHTVVLRSPKPKNNKYYAYLLKTDPWRSQIRSKVSGVKVFSVSRQIISDATVIVPPYEIQQRIVAFLDHKCAEIDSVIADTQRTIEEYKALKRSIITEAVTRGVRGTRLMKASGVEWVSEIPAEWEIIPSKYLFKNSDERRRENDVMLTASQKYGIISQEEYMERENSKIVLANKGIEDWKHVEPNDFIISLRSFQGGLEMSETTGCITWHYIVLKACRPIHSKFYKWLFKSEAYIKALQRTCNYIRDGQDLRYSNFVQVPLFDVNIAEQVEIAEYLDKKCAEIDSLITAKQQLLSELESYKKSVIYEYVTGKKEVPAEQADVISVVYPYFPATLHTNKRRFAQAILMCRILDQCPKKMGRVKLEKMLFTIENSIGFDFETEYERAAAGPLDVSIYACEGIISRVNQWYTIKTSNFGVSYVPTKDSSKYKKYYDKYFSSYDQEITRIINFFKDYDADQAEIIATLFAAWNDFLIDHKQFSDEELVDEVLNNWNDSKKRFSRDIWLGAIAQMRESDIVPKGYGKHTVRKSE